MDDAKIEHGEKSFKDIINDIDNGRLKPPPFQRGYVWNSEQIIDLLDSIYNYYPIGSFILWETKEQLSASRNIAGYILPNVDPDWPFYYVLDGQQRISTIYALFSENVNLDNNDDYSPEAEIFDIYYDISRGKFVHKSEIHEYLGHQNQQLTFIDDKKIYEREENFFRLKDLMSKNFRSLTRNFSHHETSKLDDLYNKFHDYPLPCIYIKRVPKNEVAYMFQKINASGTSLDILDLLVAWTWSEDFHLGEEIKTIQERFESDGFSLSWRTLLQCLSGIIFEKVDFSSNPDFVFENDPAFTAKQLFDEEGNTVFVNSFVECEHYVTGGWGFSPLKNNEVQMLDMMLYVVVALLVFTYSKNFVKSFLKK